MKSFKSYLDEKGRCWPGYRPVSGKKPFSPGSCVKEEPVTECAVDDLKKELLMHKEDLQNSNSKELYDKIDGMMQKIAKDWDMTGKELHDEWVDRHGKIPDKWILDEDLRQWFKQKWVRMDTKGNIKGQCARDPGEGKPKCLPQAKAHALGQKGRASAAQRKRREDPNPERRGKPINVRTK